MPTFGAPVQDPGLGPVLQELLTRIQRLESSGPRAVFQIKVFADEDPVETASNVFRIAMPPALNGWTLVEAWAQVTTAPSGGDVEIGIANDGTDMLSSPITIPDGEDCGSGQPDPATATVTDCDKVWISVLADAGAVGLDVVATFSP